MPGLKSFSMLNCQTPAKPRFIGPAIIDTPWPRQLSRCSRSDQNFLPRSFEMPHPRWHCALNYGIRHPKVDCVSAMNLPLC